MQPERNSSRSILSKNNSLCIVIAVMLVFTSIWAIASRLINAFISDFVAAELLSSTVLSFSYINLALKSIFSLVLGILLLICAKSAYGKNKAAFIVGAVGELITPLFNLAAYTLIRSSDITSLLSLIFVPLGIMLIAAMLLLFAIERENIPAVRISGIVSAVFTIILGVSNTVSCFASYMLFVSTNIQPFITMLSVSSTLNTFLSIISGILSALCFCLIYTTKEYKESVVE